MPNDLLLLVSLPAAFIEDCRLACQCPSVAEETLWEVSNLSSCLPSQPALRGCVLGTPLACDLVLHQVIMRTLRNGKGQSHAPAAVWQLVPPARMAWGQRLLWLIHSQEPSCSGGGPTNCSSACCYGMGQIKNEILLCPLNGGNPQAGIRLLGDFFFFPRKSRASGRKGIESHFSGLLCLVRWVPGPEPEKMLQSSEPTRLQVLTDFQSACPCLFPCGLLLPLVLSAM